MVPQNSALKSVYEASVHWTHQWFPSCGSWVSGGLQGRGKIHSYQCYLWVSPFCMASPTDPGNIWGDTGWEHLGAMHVCKPSSLTGNTPLHLASFSHFPQFLLRLCSPTCLPKSRNISDLALPDAVGFALGWQSRHKGMCSLLGKKKTRTGMSRLPVWGAQWLLMSITGTDLQLAQMSTSWL